MKSPKKKCKAAAVAEFLEAARRDDTETVNSYLKNGGDVNATDSSDYTALHYAVGYGAGGVFEILMNQPDINVDAKNDEGISALDFAIHHEIKGAARKMQDAKSKRHLQPA